MGQSTINSLLVWGLAALCASLSGCADSSHEGQAVLRDLERDRIQLDVDDRGEWTPPPQPPGLPDAGPITLADLIRAADQVSPEIAAARSRVGSAAGRQWQSSLYPNPSLGVEVGDMPIDDAPAGGTTTVGITQPIVLGGRLDAAKSGGEAGRRAAMSAWELRRREIHGQVAMAAAQAASARELLRVYTALRQLAEQSLTTARTRFEARAATETEVLRPQIELHRIDAAMGRARRDEAAAIARLDLMLGGMEVDASRLEDPLRGAPALADLAVLEQAVRASHPALAEAQARIEEAEARLRQIKAERTPDLEVRVAAGYDDYEGEPIMEFGAGISLPMWDRRQGDTLAARFEIATARYERMASETALLSRLADAHAAYLTASAELEVVSGSIAPAAARALEQTLEGYRGGRSSFLEVVEAQRTLFESRVATAELRAEEAEAWANIVQVVGIEHAGPVGGAAGEHESSNKELHP